MNYSKAGGKYMKNIIQHIYSGYINEEERREEETPSYEAYSKSAEKLAETFSNKQKDLFDNYFEHFCAYYAEQVEKAYERGFKTGVWLGLELYDFSPDYREE